MIPGLCMIPVLCMIPGLYMIPGLILVGLGQKGEAGASLLQALTVSIKDINLLPNRKPVKFVHHRCCVIILPGHGDQCGS